MRFMVMHKTTEEMEKGLPPDPAIIEGVGKLRLPARVRPLRCCSSAKSAASAAGFAHFDL